MMRWILVGFAFCVGAPLAACSSSDDTGASPRKDAGGGVDAGSDSAVDAGDSGGGPLLLAPGDVAEVAVVNGQAGASLATPAGDEQFVIVLASTRFDASGDTSTYSFVAGSAPSGASASLVSSCSMSNTPWKDQALPSETPPSGTAVQVGATRQIQVPLTGTSATIDAQAIAVGKSAVVWSDVTPAHPANLDSAFVAQFLSDFEDTILPRERTVFGVESDLDGDGHIALVFTPLTYQSAVAFFSGCDLVKSFGCPSSNQGEYLYLTPPATIDPPYNTPNAIKEILTHECSHLIHFNRKVLRNQLADWAESAYMVEGIGGLAQDLVGPQAGNLYVAKAGLDSIDQFSLGDTLVDGVTYDSIRDGLLRGGSYWFARFIYDRAGGDVANSDGTITSQGGPVFLRTLLDAPESIAAILPTKAGSSTEAIATDFYTALAMSNRDEAGGVAPKNPCFSYLPANKDPIWQKQRGADLFAKFSMAMTGPAMQDALGADGSLLAGGVEYLTLDAQSGQSKLEFTLNVDPMASVRVRVGRLR